MTPSTSTAAGSNAHSAVCLTLTRAIGRSGTVEEIYGAALDALSAGLGVDRASILLFDPDGVMRFKAYRALSDAYRAAVEGHTPWTPESVEPEPIVVPDVTCDASLTAYLPTIRAEGIAGMTFIPLVSRDRVIGKFMLYFAAPHAPSADDLQLAGVIASQVAFALERTRAEDTSRRSEERLRFALNAASMGTWDWDLVTDSVVWSDNLELIHGLPPGTFDGTFASYEREIHPDDRERVFASVQRALTEGTPHEVEYRLVAPDGTIRWCEGKGRVEWAGGRPVRMTGVCMMISRRKEAELAKLRAVEEVSRQKDDFLATLSHELRTPLNAILGWVQMLQNRSVPGERIPLAVDVIGRNARLQAQLIEDILDVSRIITGKLEVDRGPVPLAPLVETVVAGIAPAATLKQIAIATDVEPDLPSIDGDAKRLHQVLNNVLTNAVKFTPAGGDIAVTCRAEGSWVRLAVSDSGSGIAPDFLPFVFDRFRQADSRTTRRHGGLGLGLAITRHLVEQHGGEISAESGGLDQGTTIAIRLPAGGPPLAAVPAADASPSAAIAGLSVVIVDDQRDSRDLLSALLEQSGAVVTQCESADAALVAITTRPFDLLVADIGMPDVDGYELVRRLRRRDTSTPAIAVTAYAHPDDRDRALAAGFTAYCAKPIDAAALLETVRRITPRRP